MSDYQESVFRLLGFPIQPSREQPARRSGSDILSSAVACAAPRDAGEASPSGYACCISPFVIQYGQEVTSLFGAYRAIELYRAAAQKRRSVIPILLIIIGIGLIVAAAAIFINAQIGYKQASESYQKSKSNM